MIRAAIVFALLVLADRAAALSCVPPDAEATFDRAAAAEETYYVALGRFAFDGDATPGPNGRPRSLAARFDGIGLTRDGFTAPFARTVTLDITCAGPWCGGLAAGREMLVFLEQRPDGLHLTLPPCGGTAFETPDKALLDRIATCFRQGVCGT